MNRKKILIFVFTIIFTCISSVNFAVFAEDNVSSSTPVNVTTFEELESALMNSSVTHISIKKSITFPKSIGTTANGIPNRDVYIYGNADEGVIIDSAQWTIYGNQNKNGKNTLYIENANIRGRGTPGTDNLTDGRFFTGGGENGPKAYGWDVYAKNVKYIGARFVHLSNGTLTFDGFNEIYTNCENAWVNHVVFKAGSIYKSSNSGTGDYAAFYFNKGDLIADGTAVIEEGAETYFNIGTAVQPVFTGDVYKTTIGKNAVFDVNTIGHAIWYVAGNSTYYKLGNPEFNVEEGAGVNIKQVSASEVLNAKSGKSNPDRNLYVPVYFARSGNPEVPGTITVDEGATFNVSGATGNSSFYPRGVIRMGDGSEIILNSPKSFDIQNRAIKAPAISSNGDTAYDTHSVILTLNETDEVSVWNQLTSARQYIDDQPDKTFLNVSGTTVIKGLKTVSSSTNNETFNTEYKNENYGRISIKGGKGGLTEEEYSVTYHSNNGEADTYIDANQKSSASYTIKNGEETGISNPKYILKEWNTSSDGTGRAYLVGEIITLEENVELYAVWESKPTETCKCESGEECNCEICECETCECESCKPTEPTETCECESGEECNCEICECETCECESCKPTEPTETCECESGEECNCEICECGSCKPTEPSKPTYPIFPIYPSQPTNPSQPTKPDEELPDLPFEKNDHLKYLNGYPDRTVRPDNDITRAEVASIFYRILKSTYKDGTSSKVIFSDIPSSAWYGKAVSVLAEMGIINGYEDGTFRGDREITRAEFAAMASRFEKIEEYSGKNIFKDVLSSHWAAKYINSAYLKSWVNGYEDNNFKPEQNITRAEVVKIVNTMLDRLPETLPIIKSPYSDILKSHWAYIHIIEASLEHTYIKTENKPEIWETTSYNYSK